MMTSNRLLPILVGAVVLFTVFVGLKSCSDNGQESAVLSTVPVAPKPDADTPADTIKTLTANVSAMTAEVQSLRKDNAALKQESEQLISERRQIEKNLLAKLQQTLRTTTEENTRQRDEALQKDASRIAELTARIDALAKHLPEPVSTSTFSELPIGLGLDGLGQSTDLMESLVWVKPLEQSLTTDEPANGLLHRASRSTDSFFRSGKTQGEQWLDNSATLIDTATPVYTIPRNATLIGSTAMTALVGRVPVQGQVHDPMPFKVIAGKDNLAANGLNIPGVQGMIWSGTAMGDWTLSCVSGQLESVTFVFDDGTIQTLSSDDNNLPNSGGNAEKPLGWISDARGIPCISGERKTNAPAFLSQRIGVVAMQAAANAAAQAETTNIISDSGSVSSVVSGDSGHYVLGKTLSGGSDEIAQWLRERQAQSFDAVFVPAGIELAIHVDHELPIDFHSNGRKLYHGNLPLFNTQASFNSGLD